MNSFISKFKNLFVLEEEEDFTTADQESFDYLVGIIHFLREDASYIINGELYLENLCKRIQKNSNNRDLKILLAKYHTSFRSVYNVLQDKPFSSCRLYPKTRQTIEIIIGDFETSLNYALRDENGFDINNHLVSLDELLEIDKFKN